nr:uORF1 [Canis lupus familiaris]
MDSLGC